MTKWARWTDEDEATLEKLAGKKDEAEIAEQLGRTPGAVGAHAAAMGLSLATENAKPSKPAFLDEEKQIIRDNAGGKLTSIAISDLLKENGYDRSPGAVRMWVRRHGLSLKRNS